MKNNKFGLILIIIGLVLIIALASIAFYYLWKNKNVSQRSDEYDIGKNVQVQALKDDKEKELKTILYPGGKILEEKKENNKLRIVFETTDSVDGAINIYYQDLINRYPNYSVTETKIDKNGALGKATVLLCSGQVGKITVTAWTNQEGLTNVEVVTENSFR